jgi:hypothetical protein
MDAKKKKGFRVEFSNGKVNVDLGELAPNRERFMVMAATEHGLQTVTGFRTREEAEQFRAESPIRKLSIVRKVL